MNRFCLRNFAYVCHNEFDHKRHNQYTTKMLGFQLVEKKYLEYRNFPVIF